MKPSARLPKTEIRNLLDGHSSWRHLRAKAVISYLEKPFWRALVGLDGLEPSTLMLSGHDHFCLRSDIILQTVCKRTRHTPKLSQRVSTGCSDTIPAPRKPHVTPETP